jgi:nucleoid-associated protein YgaU
MVRPRRSGFAFWFLLVLLALGVGWAANQEWRWPLLGLFDQDGEADGQAPAPDVVAEPADEQPATQDSTAEVAGSGDEPAAEVTEPGGGPAAQTAEGRAETMPGAADPAAPAGQDLAAGPSSEQASPPAPAAGVTADPTAEPNAASGAGPSEAEVAAIEPGDTEGAAPQGLEAARPTPEAAVSEPQHAGPGGPEQDPARELPAGGEAGNEAAGVASTDPLSSSAEAGTEGEAAPSFDLVRVGRDGRAVIAGRAAPGAEVEVRLGGQVIDRVQATRRGEWVAIPAKPLAPGDQELSAVASRDGQTVESDQVVVVAVPGPTEPTTPAVATETAVPAEPVAVLLPRDGPGTGRILQAPGRLSAEGTLALMTVSYDQSGEVRLTGEAPPGVPVRIYVDNRPAALVVGDAKGAWSSGLGETLAPGTYTLRLDQLDADGKAVARIETPFTRVSDPPVEGNLQVDYVVVQPGNSLWRIARRLSGRGLDYVHIYGVNQTQIRDPDLIYPGQVFEIPATIGSAG